MAIWIHDLREKFKADPVNQKAKEVLLAKRRQEEVSKFWVEKKSLCWILSVFI